MSRLAADNPAHRRIMAQTLSVIDVLVAGEATKDRLPEQPGQCVPAILAGAGVTQDFVAIDVSRSASSSSRYPSNPASEVTTEPRNWSINRRAKSNLRVPSFDSPAGCAMIGASMCE
jgi:hypothetical protein